MAKTSKKIYGPGIAGTQKELADYLDVDEKAVRRWMDKDEWPFGRKGPFKVKKVRLWTEEYLDQDISIAARKRGKKTKEGKSQYSNSPLTKARVEGTNERTLLTRQRRLIEEAKLIYAEEAQKIRLRQIQAVKSALLSLPRSVANALIGKTRNKIEDILKDRIEEIIGTFAGE